MKKLILIMLLVSPFFLILVKWGVNNSEMSNEYNFYALEHLKEEKLANQILAKLAKQLTSKYHLRVVGDSAAMPGGVINELGLIFDIYRALTKEEIREILVGCVEAFLQEINSNEEIRPHLKVFPFTAKNVSISLGIYQADRKEIYDPGISSAWASNGKIRYNTKNKHQKYGYKNEYRESFEEAEQLVKEAQNRKNGSK
jgi:hypothetical protein